MLRETRPSRPLLGKISKHPVPRCMLIPKLSRWELMLSTVPTQLIPWINNRSKNRFVHHRPHLLRERESRAICILTASSRISMGIRPRIVPRAWFPPSLNRAQMHLSLTNSIKRKRAEYGSPRFHCNGIIPIGHHWHYSDNFNYKFGLIKYYI